MSLLFCYVLKLNFILIFIFFIIFYYLLLLLLVLLLSFIVIDIIVVITINNIIIIIIIIVIIIIFNFIVVVMITNKAVRVCYWYQYSIITNNDKNYCRAICYLFSNLFSQGLFCLMWITPTLEFLLGKLPMAWKCFEDLCVFLVWIQMLISPICFY